MESKRNVLWSEEEIEYLHNKWGEASMAKIAKKLGRTIYAVKCKAKKEGLTNMLDHLDGITLNQLGKVFNVSYNVVYKKWVQDWELPYKVRITKETREFKYICIDDFWKWAYKHRSNINFSKLERNILGKEPAWVKQKRQIDAECCTYMKINVAWTPAEDKQLRFMLSQYRYTCSEISEVLCRTENAINRRIGYLKIRDRPLIVEKKPWTPEDTDTLLDMKNEGFGDNIIAKKLDRSATSIKDRLNKLSKDPEYNCRMQFYKMGKNKHS